jgi:hypothetical protein
MKKLVIYTTIGTILVVSGVLVTSSVNAQELNVPSNPFFQKVAERLGVDQTELVDVIDEVREDMHAQREAERAETIATALDEGSLSEKQAEILNAIEDLNLGGRPADIEEWREYTPEQKEALREAREETRHQAILDGLYDAGLEVTQDELDELHTVMEDIGIGMYGMRSEGGMGGKGMGMHR